MPAGSYNGPMASSFDRRRSVETAKTTAAANASAMAPGKQTLVEAVGPIQRRADSAAASVPASADVGAIARTGVADASAPLPHLGQIQHLFGRHDVSGVRAQVGGTAAEATQAIGASAYATGDRVAFAQAPDLHTAAHEAAHVVQQRAGVHLKGGVGEVNDRYECHADAVADLVVQNRPAEAALDELAGGGSGGTPAVQRKMEFRSGTDYLNIDGAGAHIALTGYQATLREAISMPNEIIVEEGIPKVGTAAYTPDHGMLSGEITIRPLDPAHMNAKNQEYNDRLIAMAHETRHGIDDLTKKVKFRNNDDEKIHTEWRAFATQSAVAWQLAQQGEKVSDRYLLDMASYASKTTFMQPTSKMAETTGSYMRHYKININPSATDIAQFMQDHEDWVDEAIALFNSLKPAQVSPAVAQNLRPAGVNETDWTQMLKAAGWIAGGVATAIIIKLLGSYFGLF